MPFDIDNRDSDYRKTADWSSNVPFGDPETTFGPGLISEPQPQLSNDEHDSRKDQDPTQ